MTEFYTAALVKTGRHDHDHVLYFVTKELPALLSLGVQLYDII
jgi:hypothetical protein